MRRLLAAVATGFAALATVPAAHAQSISPPTFSTTMNVGQTIVINKTITLGSRGASLVDLFFLADNTGSMGGIISAAEAGATDIMNGVSAGGDFMFGVGRYLGDPSEGVPPASAYQLQQDLTASIPTAQAAIAGWFASGGGDFPEGNFFALQQVANTTSWRTGSQRLVIWFGDAPAHTTFTSQADALSALVAADAKVIAFNSVSAGSGIDQGGQASAIVAGTGGSLHHNFNSLSNTEFVDAVNAAITSATAEIDLVFGHTLVGSGLTISFACTDPLGCDDVAAGESRTFDVSITANTPGVYNFDVFANGVGATETDMITVVGGGSVVPEPSTWLLLATGLFGLGFVARRRGVQGAV